MHKLMVVDDEAVVAMQLEERLTSVGYEVAGRASSGESAVDMAAQLRPDLILMDIVMPGKLDGIAAAEMIRAKWGIPIIFLTAYTDDKFVDRAKEVQPSGYIVKPSGVKEIKAAIEIALYRKDMDQQLRESEEKCWSLVDNAGDCIICVDSGGRIVFWNEGAKSVFGYSAEEAHGKTLTFLVPEQYREDIEKRIKSPASTAKSDFFEKPVECFGLRKNGSEFPLEFTLGAWNAKDKTHFTSVIRDVTGRRHAEEEKNRLEAQLQLVRKMEAMGTLVGGIAHEFNNILAIIVGNTELAMYNIPERGPAQPNLQEVRTACLRAKNVVRQLLTFSCQTEQERKPVKIGPIVKKCLELMRSSIPTTIDICHNILCESDTVLADPTKIDLVLINLCTNAAHAMREKGGTLEISLEALELDEDAKGQYQDATPGSYVRLTVSDTGNGIEPELVDRIFDPYFTTKGVGEGTGMGLFVVRGILKNHGGAITIKSEVGKGTTVDVFFPCIESGAKVEPETSKALPTGNERILFIDDEQALVKMGKQMLECLWYAVVTRTSSVEALELFQNQPDLFDLVITDMTMPDMTGDQLAKELMKIRPDIPIILCTGHSERISEEKAKGMGIRAFAMKPLFMRDLAKTIREVLDKSNGE